MGLSDQLSSLSQSLSSQKGAAAQDIQRLREAKQKVIHEQAAGYEERQKLTQPFLGAAWTGTRADAFNEDRDAASEKLNAILNVDFEGYIRAIEVEISLLESKMSVLVSLGFAANEVGDLINQGEEMVDAAQEKLTALSRRVWPWS